jgi:ectoine hydroxylase-related dioxygenase (phytanoyl-CoA dioxygenase family)
LSLPPPAPILSGVTTRTPPIAATTPDDVKTALRDHGYCVVRSVLSAADVEAVTRRLRVIAARAALYRHLGVHFNPASAVAGWDAGDPLARFEQIGHVPFLDATVRARLLAHPGLTRLAAAVLGPDIDVVNAGFFLKAPGGAEVPWHQDAATWGVPVGAWTPENAPTIFDFWLALDHADARNGCLELLPGSERLGILPHASWGGLLPEADPAAFGLDPDARVAFRAAPGDLVVYHQDMFHRSDANRSARPRLAAAGSLIAHADAVRLRALLPDLPTLERRPLCRGGRPVALRHALPERPSRWRVACRRLARDVGARLARRLGRRSGGGGF